MEPDDIVRLALRGLSHGADEALAELVADGSEATEDAVAAAGIFLRVISCRFDDALEAADTLAARRLDDDRLAVAAIGMARAVCTGTVTDLPANVAPTGSYRELIETLELETAMSSGLIASADVIATQMLSDCTTMSLREIWAGIGLVRAQSFAGRFTEASVLIDRVLAAPALADLPQLLLLARSSRLFVDGNLGNEDAVTRGLLALRQVVPESIEHNYVFAGSYVLAAFGANAIGRLAEAAELILHGGGGDHLPHLQLVDRIYGYELLVEDALARGDDAAALLWAERAASLPVERHHMAAAALGRIRARVAVSQRDNVAGIRESSDSRTLAALVGGDLEVMRARIIEASARAASGDRVRGIDDLEEAARRANVTGASAVRAWAERELAAHGRRIRNVPGDGWDVLTPTQKVIARLAASGLRNREIAATLFVSQKTVESHVAAVLGALGTTNRVGIGRELGGDQIDPVFGSKVTPRQREVAVLVARGLSNSAISQSLSISEKTVEKHVADMFDRLQVKTRSALAACVRGPQSPATPES
jgi:DNA-binding NarL/FixJ family response regulator